MLHIEDINFATIRYLALSLQKYPLSGDELAPWPCEKEKDNKIDQQ